MGICVEHPVISIQYQRRIIYIKRGQGLAKLGFLKFRGSARVGECHLSQKKTKSLGSLCLKQTGTKHLRLLNEIAVPSLRGWHSSLEGKLSGQKVKRSEEYLDLFFLTQHGQAMAIVTMADHLGLNLSSLDFSFLKTSIIDCEVVTIGNSLPLANLSDLEPRWKSKAPIQLPNNIRISHEGLFLSSESRAAAISVMNQKNCKKKYAVPPNIIKSAIPAPTELPFISAPSSNLGFHDSKDTMRFKHAND